MKVLSTSVQMLKGRLVTFFIAGKINIFHNAFLMKQGEKDQPCILNYHFRCPEAHSNSGKPITGRTALTQTYDL